MHVHADVLRPQGFKHGIPRHAQLLLVDLDHEEVVRVGRPGGVVNACDFRCEVRECRAVERRDLLAAGDELVEAGQLGEPERALDVRDAVVVPQRHHLVVVHALAGALERVGGDAVRAEQLELGVVLLGVRDDHAALAGAEVLDGVEREGGEVREGADGAAVERRAVGVRRVGDEHEVVLVADRAERDVVAGLAAVVHREDGLGARRDLGLDGGRVDVERGREDVCEDGGCAGEEHAVGGGREGEG
mmetsp:Transcript_12586/g.31832  ORF Transcript_12586/g.31832 Transcript_12586/m.31832 type:complete len:246 (+) Transcript_12586:381-1118(+)